MLDTIKYIGDKAQVCMVIGLPRDEGVIEIIYANRAACDLFGYSSMEGLDVRRLMPDYAARNHKQYVSRYMESELDLRLRPKTIIGAWRDLTAVRKDGTVFPVHANVCDLHGESRMFLAFFQDRTQSVMSQRDLDDTLAQLKAANSNFSRLVSAVNANNIVVRFDRSGQITDVNRAFCELVKLSRSELLEMSHRDLVEEEDAKSPKYRVFWDRLRNGHTNKGTYRRKAADGTYFWLAGSYVPVKDDNGSVVEIIKIATDITEQVKDRIELQTKNSYLEHAAKILRHDMHSGINTYMPRGMSGLERKLEGHEDIVKKLRLDMPLRLLREGLKHTQKVYAGVKEFTNLVKPDAVLHLELLDLKAILEEYLESTAYRRQVIIEDLPTASVNGPLFCTAVDNLIRNGLKYNDSPTKFVKILEVDGDIAIIDNGRGMTEKEFQAYSEPYVRKPGQAESGSGLGLNICIAILREHGFAVSCEKLPAGGTCIRIRIHDQ